jgi:mono/diheme cytochrome c family protein
VYLASLPDSSSPVAVPPDALTADAQRHVDSGGKIYERHCKDCHGTSGEGAPGAYPVLAGNPGVTLPSPLNTIRSVLDGGFVPSTRANPRPYGMPPFGQTLTNQEVAQVVSYVRHAWGNRASLVTAIDVDKSGSD